MTAFSQPGPESAPVQPVLDSEPDELVQVVGYLQSVTDKIDIDLG